MKTSDNGRKLIEQFEGLELQAYDDATDKVVPIGGQVHGTLTIGYGHTDAAGLPTVFVGQTITQAQADEILSNDLGAVEQDVTNLVKVPLNQNQFDALVSFQFNTGALGHSTALKVLNEGNYAAVPQFLGLYTHAQGRVLQGLVNRRNAENLLFMTAPKLSVPISIPTTPSAPTPTPAPTPVPSGWQAFLNILIKILNRITGKK